jgi:hypothetical protein
MTNRRKKKDEGESAPLGGERSHLPHPGGPNSPFISQRETVKK